MRTRTVIWQKSERRKSSKPLLQERITRTQIVDKHKIVLTLKQRNRTSDMREADHKFIH